MEAANLPLWLTEDITWPVLWGILAIGIFAMAWFITQKITPLIFSLVCLLLLIGAVVLEYQVVTDREYLENAVYSMADAVRNNDAEGVAAFVSDELPDLKSTIHREKERFHVNGCSIIGFRESTLRPNDVNATEATIGFSVFGSGSFVSRNLDYSGPLAVDLDFRKIKGQWSIVKFSYYPTNAPNKVRSYQ
jgi:hypothetical protein